MSIDVAMSPLRLRHCHGYDWVLAERADSRLVHTGCVTLASCLRPAVVYGLHRVGEVVNDLVKIHTRHATLPSRERCSNQRRYAASLSPGVALSHSIRPGLMLRRMSTELSRILIHAPCKD
jgi:hypothetical protein